MLIHQYIVSYCYLLEFDYFNLIYIDEMRKNLAALDWNENVRIKERAKKTRHFRQKILTKYLLYCNSVRKHKLK